MANINDVEEVHAVMLAAALNETLCLTLQAHDLGRGLTPEIVEKLRNIHAQANLMLGLDADA